MTSACGRPWICQTFWSLEKKSEQCHLQCNIVTILTGLKLQKWGHVDYVFHKISGQWWFLWPSGFSYSLPNGLAENIQLWQAWLFPQQSTLVRAVTSYLVLCRCDTHLVDGKNKVTAAYLQYAMPFADHPHTSSTGSDVKSNFNALNYFPKCCLWLRNNVQSSTKKKKKKKLKKEKKVTKHSISAIIAIQIQHSQFAPCTHVSVDTQDTVSCHHWTAHAILTNPEGMYHKQYKHLIQEKGTT